MNTNLHKARIKKATRIVLILTFFVMATAVGLSVSYILKDKNMNQQVELESRSAEKSVLVLLGNKEFTPASLSIEQGKSVSFKNTTRAKIELNFSSINSVTIEPGSTHTMSFEKSQKISYRLGNEYIKGLINLSK